MAEVQHPPSSGEVRTATVDQECGLEAESRVDAAVHHTEGKEMVRNDGVAEEEKPTQSDTRAPQVAQEAKPEPEVKPEHVNVQRRPSPLPLDQCLEFDVPGLEADVADPSSSGEKSPTTPRSLEELVVRSPTLPFPEYSKPTVMLGGAAVVEPSESLGVIDEEDDSESNSTLHLASPSLPPIPVESADAGVGRSAAVDNNKELPPLPPHSPEPTGQNGQPPRSTGSSRLRRAPSTVTGLSRSTWSVGSTSSDEAPRHSARRRSPSSRLGSLLARLGLRHNSNDRYPPEGFLEKRTLTPFELAAPRESLGEREGEEQIEDDHLPGGGALPSPGLESDMTAVTTREPVFGVSLADSLHVAKIKVRISHSGRTNSYRSYPPSVYKCCEFIHNSGASDRNVFNAPGDASNVSELKELFSSPPDYGEHIDFSDHPEYTVYDAARLVLLYLEELSTPLVPPAVVKRWVLLARQEGVIEPRAPRIETGLDFWIEALNPLPVASRNLVKYLLNLFSLLVTSSGSFSDIEARRLAAIVSRSLFHLGRRGDPGRRGWGNLKGCGVAAADINNVIPTLALAFLIRKRAEYTGSLGRVGSHKRNSDLFLPSTQEIMEWRGS